jgi:hypothetical protein
MTSAPAEILAGAAAKLLELGRLDPARTIAELALSEDSGCANSHSVFAVVCEALAQWQQGLEHGRRAVELLPARRSSDTIWRCRRCDWATTRPALQCCRRGSTNRTGPPWRSRRAPPPAAAGRLGRGPAYSGSHRAGSRRLHHVPALCAVARGARIAVACSPPLRPVFERITGVVTVLSPRPEQPFGQDQSVARRI